MCDCSVGYFPLTLSVFYSLHKVHSFISVKLINSLIYGSLYFIFKDLYTKEIELELDQSAKQKGNNDSTGRSVIKQDKRNHAIRKMIIKELASSY